MTAAFVLALALSVPSVPPPTPTCNLSGVVTGVIPDGALVELRRQMEWTTVQTWRVKLGKEGRFKLPVVPYGWYRVSASAPGRVPNTRAILCRDGVVSPPQLKLEPGGVRIRGTVRDTDGTPLAGTEVSVVELARPRPEKVFEVATYVVVDDDGEFAFEVKPERSYRVFAQAPGHRFDSREVNLDPSKPRLITHVDASAELVEVDFRLIREPAIQGRVLTAAGKPAAGAEVYLGPIGFGGPRKVIADDKGRFHMPAIAPQTGKTRPPVRGERVPPQPKPLVIAARWQGEFAWLNVGVLREGEDRDANLDLTVGRRITGVLRGEDGRPRLGSVMWREFLTGFYGWVNTDTRGRFTIEGAPARRAVEVFAAGGDQRVVEVPPGDDTVEVVFAPRAER